MSTAGSVIKLDPTSAEKACRDIASTLPEWFGIPEANERYAQGVRERLCLGYIINGECVGMLSLEFPFHDTASIYWMGVKKGKHRKGVGSSLLRHAESYCLQNKYQTITVETLSPKEKNVSYLKTFAFYCGEGFRPLFELNTYGKEFLMVYLFKPLSLHLFRWINMTHVLHDKIPTWDGSCGFRHQDILKYEDCPGVCKFLVQRFEMLAGAGTHIDAPAHCFPDGKTVEYIDHYSKITHSVMIDVSKEAGKLYTVGMDAIEQFEKSYGEIGEDAFVLFYTGWERFWDEPEKYHNNHCFPCIGKDVAEYLVSKNSAGIGIDTLSPDRGDNGFPVHQIILGAGKYIVENVAGAKHMPPRGGNVCIVPLRIRNATEAPIALLGCWP